MKNLSDGNAEFQDLIRAVQVFYMTKYPTSADPVVYASAKALIEFCNKDLEYIEQIIMGLSELTADGKIPPFNYVAKAVRESYKKKVNPKPSLSEQEILAMCEFTAHQKMMIDLGSTRVTDYIPEDELPFTGFSDPNLRKMIDGWYEDGKIDDYWYQHAIKGIVILTTEWKGLVPDVSV